MTSSNKINQPISGVVILFYFLPVAEPRSGVPYEDGVQMGTIEKRT